MSLKEYLICLQVELPIGIPSVTIEAATPEPKAVAPSVLDQVDAKSMFIVLFNN